MTPTIPPGHYLIAEHVESFGVLSCDGTMIAYVYFDVGTDEVSRKLRKRMTKEEARIVAEKIKAIGEAQE